MKTIFIVITFFLSLILNSSNLYAQNSDDKLNELLTGVQLQTINYRDSFKNFVVEEDKTVREYKKNEIDEERIVKSNLIVYETTVGDKLRIDEFRNVLSVDGKPIKNNVKRIERIFKKATSKNSIEKELDILRKESLRYDKSMRIDGQTFAQVVYLGRDFKPFFEFKMLENETFNEIEYKVVSYQQIKEASNIKIDITIDRESIKKLDLILDENNEPISLYRGKIWISPENLQVLREEKEIYFPRNNNKEDFVFTKMSYEYNKSEFGIPLPQKIVWTFFQPSRKNSKIIFVRSQEMILEYSNFRKTDTMVESYETNNTKPQ